MDIGVISDIHGDYEALERVLDRLDNHHKVKYILCAGDLVGRGTNPNRVVDVIRQRGIIAVRGNHDEWFYPLSEANAAYLNALPVDLKCAFGKVEIFICHGKPGSNLWGLYQDHVSDTLLNMMLKSLRVNVLITGHTHIPMYIQVDRGCVINPGSIFTFKSARTSSHTYGVLRLSDLSFDLYDLMADPVMPLPL